MHGYDTRGGIASSPRCVCLFSDEPCSLCFRGISGIERSSEMREILSIKCSHELMRVRNCVPLRRLSDAFSGKQLVYASRRARRVARFYVEFREMIKSDVSVYQILQRFRLRESQSFQVAGPLSRIPPLDSSSAPVLLNSPFSFLFASGLLFPSLLLSCSPFFNDLAFACAFLFLFTVPSEIG